MKIPNNMTEEQVFSVIENVIKKIAPKYSFNGYDVDDIKQESFLICMDALKRYDQNRPLENFLAVHLSNRLKNFVRDNHYVKDVDESKKKIINAKRMGYDTNIIKFVNDSTKIEIREIASIIDKKLPPEYRVDYLKILSNTYVNKKRREEIMGFVHNILKEHGYA
jgi:DNA-directed RNA polymerase specialized sigma24 family protein